MAPLVMAAPSTQIRRRRRSRWTIVRFAVAVIAAAAFLVPLLLAAMGGLKNNGELVQSPLALPTHPKWSNYGNILQASSFWLLMRNSVIVLVLVTAGVLVASTLAAFLFARLDFKGKNLLFGFFMLGLLFPIAVAVLPLFVTLRTLHLTDSLTGVVLVEIAFGIPGNILLLRSFFVRTVPKEIEEAAYVDGCGEIGFFWRILLPMSRPAIAAVGVLTMVVSWNTYFLPLLVLNNAKKWTLPLGVGQFQGEHGTDWPSIMAFVTLSIVPAIVFYLFAERHLVAGLTAGAVKG